MLRLTCTPTVHSALLALGGVVFAAAAEASLPVGQKPPTVTISGDDGSLVDGKPWSSDMIKGKVWAFFYVDPDERDLNPDLENALAAQKFDLTKYGSMSVVNMGATWLPNSVLASKLEDKQKERPNTIFAKDLKKILVDRWKLKDDAYNVLVFDEQGNVVFAKDGKFDKPDIEAMIAVIKKNLED